MSRPRRPATPRPEVVDATPSSLTKIPAAARRRCPACGGTRLTLLAMTLTDGSPVEFRSCHDCEHKGWTAPGADLAMPVAEVLDRARKVKAS